jgi:hypothetical protein
VGRREKAQEGGGEKMNFVENYENLAKAFYNAGGTGPIGRKLILKARERRNEGVKHGV